MFRFSGRNGSRFLAGLLWGVLIALTGMALAVPWIARQTRAGRKAELRARALAQTSVQVNRGPWGCLEAFAIPLANPESESVDHPARLDPPRWVFEGITEDRLVKFFQSCDLRSLHRHLLLNRKYWSYESNSVVVHPPMPLVWSLSPTAREQIYSVLSVNEVNHNQAFPLRFREDAFEVQFQLAGLRLRDIRFIKGLTYSDSGTVLLSDLQVIQDALAPQEYERFLETVFAVPAYALRLHVRPGDDLPGLIQYWGRGGREALTGPLLTALSRVPGGGSISVSYLLPPFARLHLYTYPKAWNDATAPRQDCFYTALNFFAETPNTNFLDAAYAQRVLETDFEATEDDPRFGDLIIMLDGKGQGLHACVYLADEFVFTKNGSDVAQPWVIMRLSDVILHYFTPRSPTRLLVLRQKPGTPGSESN